MSLSLRPFAPSTSNLLLIGWALCLLILQSKAQASSSAFLPYVGLEPINNTAATSWTEADALGEIQTDLDNMLTACPNEIAAHLAKIANYSSTGFKVIRGTAVQIITYAALLHAIPGLTTVQKDDLYDKITALGIPLSDAFKTLNPSYIEGKSMRGWPIKLGTDTLEFDGYQGGHMIEAVSVTAEEAALRGNMTLATDLALKAAAAFHDGFLTSDKDRTKLNADQVLVYVHPDASSGRKNRYKGLHTDYECIKWPQATNRALTVASAGIGLLRAFGAIGWIDGSANTNLWNLDDADGNSLSRSAYVLALEDFVTKSFDFHQVQKSTERTGNSALDMYPGSDNTKWFYWRYRDVQGNCNLGSSDRPEDQGHMQHVLKWGGQIRALGKDYYSNADYFGFEAKHIRRQMVSVRNRIVDSTQSNVEDRITCDLDGETDPATKSCSNGRAQPRRTLIAGTLLTAANNGYDDYSSDSDTCNDALGLAKDILPIFLHGSNDYYFDTATSDNIYCDQKQNMLAPLLAKYYYYWYDQGTC